MGILGKKSLETYVEPWFSLTKFGSLHLFPKLRNFGSKTTHIKPKTTPIPFIPNNSPKLPMSKLLQSFQLSFKAQAMVLSIPSPNSTFMHRFYSEICGFHLWPLSMHEGQVISSLILFQSMENLRGS